MIASYLAARFYDDNLSYSTINVIRSAISATHTPVDNVPVGQHPLICRLLKGMFNARPPVLKIIKPWKVSLVLDALRTWDVARKLSLRLLTLKTVFLLALVSLKRASDIHRIVMLPDVFYLGSRRFCAQPVGLGKVDRPGHVPAPILINAFLEDPCIDPVFYLNCYVRRTEQLRGSHKQLFISFKKPYKPVSVQTISRWLVNTLNICGVVGVSGHSTRGVGATTAAQAGVNIDAILSAADWTGPNSFCRHYFKPDMFSVSRAILNSAE